MCQRSHLLLDILQLGLGVTGHQALAHHRQIDVLIMRMGNRKRSVNAKGKCVPHDLTCLIRNLDGANHEQAHLLLWGQFEVIEDQLDGDA